MSRPPNLAAWILAARQLSATVMLLVVAMHAEGEIIVSRSESGTVSVRYEILNDVSELHFYVDSPIIRDDYWRLETASLQLQSDSLVASPGTSFTQATATLIPNDRPLDRVYPSLIPFDETTSLVNIDYIRAREGTNVLPIVVKNAYDPYEQECVSDYSIVYHERPSLADTAGRYVFLGTSYEDCTSALSAAIPRIFVSDETSSELEELVTRTFTPLYEQLSGRLDISIRPEPTVFVSQIRESTFDGFQADVGWNSLISLRIFGSALDIREEASSTRILNVLLHEAVHLWIGTTFQIAGQPGRAWLHEGAAEYIALRELLKQELISHDYFREIIEEHLGGCSLGLGTMSLMTERAPQGGRLVYDCGVLIQFVYDIVTHAESSGQRTVIDIWRELMSASLDAGTYAVMAEDFLASNPTAREILSSALYGPQMDTAIILEELLKFSVDATLEKETTTSTIMRTLLGEFFRSDCESGPWGWFTMDDHLALDANDTCQSIPAGFVLRYMQDQDVLQDASGAFESVSRVCTEVGVVRLSGRTPDEPSLTLQCPGPMPDSPKRIVIRELPRL